MNTKQHLKQLDMVFLQTDFRIFPDSVECLVVNQDIQSILSKNIWNIIKQAKRGTTRKTNNQRQLKIDVVVEKNTIANVIKLRNIRDVE